MRRQLLALALLVALSAPAAAAPQQVVWDGSGCEETAAVLGGRAAAGEAIIALVYRCTDAILNGKTISGSFSVSEISLMRADGSSTLLRQVTDSVELHQGLRSLGLKDSYMGTIRYGSGGTLDAPKVTVSFGNRRYSFSGTAATSPVPPTPTMGGASYTYEGTKGTITLAYANHNQSVIPALVTVDATDDPQLGEWMASETATGAGIIATGNWTGTARLSE